MIGSFAIGNLSIGDKPAASSPSISAAITEGSDVVAANVNLWVSASAAITEGSDTVAATLAAVSGISAVITEGSDTVAASANLWISASAAITEGSDTATAAVSLVNTLSAAITEGSDTFAASVTVSAGTATLSAAITEGSDTVSAALSVPSATTGAGHWKGPVEPYRTKAEEDRPEPKKKTVIRTVKAGPVTIPVVEQVPAPPLPKIRPAMNALAELTNKKAAADAVRKQKLRAIALADDEWLMVA